MSRPYDSHHGHAAAPRGGFEPTAAPHDCDDRALAELIAVFSDPGPAVLLARRAGFPRALLPAFTTSWAFWTDVVDKARDGVLPNGARALFEHAAQVVPNNSVLAGYLDGSDDGADALVPADVLSEAELPVTRHRWRLVSPPPLDRHPSPWVMAMFLVLGFVLAALLARTG
ncbi:MAG: effector-associated domain EAD1-containing protein [Myxococcota bacterium]